MGLPDNRRGSLLILPPPLERSESFARSRRLEIDDLNRLIERCCDRVDQIAVKRGGKAKGKRVYELADLLFKAAPGIADPLVSVSCERCVRPSR